MAYNVQTLLLQKRPPYLCRRKVLRPTADSSHVCTICSVCKLLDCWHPAAEQDTLWTAGGQTCQNLKQRQCIFCTDVIECTLQIDVAFIRSCLLCSVYTFGSGCRLLYWRRSSADPKRSPDSRDVLQQHGRHTLSTDERLACWRLIAAVHFFFFTFKVRNMLCCFFF